MDKQTNRQRKLEQRTVRMFSATWKVEDIFPGWSRTKLEDWGSSDPRFIEMNAALAAFELSEALGFGNDEEEMRRAEQFFGGDVPREAAQDRAAQRCSCSRESSPWRGGLRGC